MSENYTKKYEVGSICLDAPNTDFIYELPLLAFGDVQHSVGLSLVFNSRFATENPFYISSGFKFNIFKRLILNSNGDKPIEFEDEYGKRFALIDCVDKFTFDDESQRVVRKTGDRKFEIHYPDLSIEEYDGYGRIYRVRDKYGVTYLEYYYSAQGKLETVTYRSNKSIKFNYNSTSGLLENVQYTYNGQVVCTTGFGYTSNSNTKIAHYTGVDYHLSYSSGQLVAYCTDRGVGYSISHGQKLSCTVMSNGAIIKKEIGNKTVDRVQYDFLKVVDDKIRIMDVTNLHGVKTRMHFNGEDVVYSYEISDEMFSNDENSLNHIYLGKVNFHVKDQIAGTQGYTDGTRMTYIVNECEPGYDMYISHQNPGQPAMLTGWLKSVDNVDECGIIIYDAGEPVKTIPIGSLAENTWIYFTVPIPEIENGNQTMQYTSIFAGPTVTTDKVKMTDFRLIYNDNDSHSTTIESVLINPVGQTFPIKEATFYFATGAEIENANVTNNFSNLPTLDLTNKYITDNDILKYQLSMAIGHHIYEGYLCDCRDIFYRNKPMAVKLGENLYDLTTVPVGKKYTRGDKTYLSSNKVGTGDILLTQISCIDGAEISRQEYNTYLDVIHSLSDGLGTVYHYLTDSNGTGTGLVTRKVVGGIATEATYDLNDFTLISTKDEFNVTTAYTTDPVWGVVTATACSGESIEDSFDQYKSVLTQRTFSDSKTHNFGYSGGNLTSLSSGSLNYGFTYNCGSLATVSKCSTQIEEHVLSDSDKVLTSSYPDSNNAMYSVAQRTDNYGRQTQIDDVIKNTYDINPTYANGTYDVIGIDNGVGKLALSEDMVTGNKTRYGYGSKGVTSIGTFDISEETKLSEETFDYDSLGRLTKNNYTFGTNTVGNEFTYLIDENTYNADKRIGSAKYKVNGAVKSTATNYYDSYKRIKRKLISLGNTYDRNITYNQTRISKVMDVKNGSTINNVSYTYDTHGRITGESDSVNTNVNTTYVYDSFGQLIRENNKALDKTFVYEYNGIGNIVSVKTYAYTTAATPSGTPTVTSYSYDGTQVDRLTSFGGKGVSYNTLGYPIGHDGMSYVWTKGKLTRQFCGSKTQAGTLYKDTTFTYDAYGRRLSKSHTYDTNPVSSSDYSYTYNTTYDYDSSGRLVHETCVEATTYTGGSSSTREITYLYDESGIIGAIQTLNSTTTDRYYFDRNIRGDVIAIYSNSGTKIATYSYDSWGNCTTKTLVSNNFSNYNPIRYRGYYYDRETKLYYLNARYYNPQWRRFISPDSTEYIDPENPNGLNLYAYCGNDPVNYADPSGHSITAVLLLSAFVIGATTGGVISIASQWIEDKEINPWLVFSDAMFGGVSGLLAASGIGALGSAFLGATLNGLQVVITSAIEKREIDSVEFLTSVVIGFAGGFIPKTGINAKQVSGKLGVIKMHLSTAVGDRRKIMYELKKTELMKQLVGRTGNYIVSTIASNISTEVFSNNIGVHYYGYGYN